MKFGWNIFYSIFHFILFKSKKWNGIENAFIRYVLSSLTIRLGSHEIGPAKKTLKMRRCNN